MLETAKTLACAGVVPSAMLTANVATATSVAITGHHRVGVIPRSSTEMPAAGQIRLNA